MIKLYKHQEHIINQDPKRALFALGTGSAKTLTALLLAEGKILCITPKQQREEKNFIREAKKWDLDKDITQMSKEDFKKHAVLLRQYDTIIIDEAHTVAGITPNIRYKNKKPIPKASHLYDDLIAYLDKYPPKRLYLLTATPTRSPMCVYGLARILGKQWNFYEFRDIFYFSVKRGFREFFIPRNDERVKDRLGKIVRSLGYTGRLEDYFDVPDQVFKDIFVEPTKEQKDRLRELSLEYPDPLVRTGKSHQVENGILAGNEFAPPEIIKDNKIDVLKDLAIEFPKLVIFARYTSQIKKIEKELAHYNVITLQGNTKDRGQVIEKANNATECIIIIQSQISAGFELPTFPVMVFASMDYSIVNYTQGIGRILRANALKKNLYIHLVTRGGVDQAVYKSIKNKETFSEKIYAEKQTNN